MYPFYFFSKLHQFKTSVKPAFFLSQIQPLILLYKILALPSLFSSSSKSNFNLP